MPTFAKASVGEDGKKHAIPSLHRDSFLAKIPGFCPDAEPGNAS